MDHVDDVLRRAPLFEALDDDSAAALKAGVTVVELSRAQRLFEEGASGNQLSGEMFGELSLFDPRPRTASATAVTDSRLAALAHDDLRSWLTGRPDVALHLLRALAQRLRRANDVMADLVFTDVPGRVAKALLDLSDRFGTPQEDGLQVNHDLTQEELAQLVGASRETVNKALADFAARGWLQLSAKSVLLIEPERLRKRSR